MLRRKVFRSPVAGFRIDLKIRLTASMGSTAGRYITIRYKEARRLIPWASNTAKPSEITVFTMIVTTVKVRVFQI